MRSVTNVKRTTHVRASALRMTSRVFGLNSVSPASSLAPVDRIRVFSVPPSRHMPLRHAHGPVAFSAAAATLRGESERLASMPYPCAVWFEHQPECAQRCRVVDRRMRFLRHRFIMPAYAGGRAFGEHGRNCRNDVAPPTTGAMVLSWAFSVGPVRSRRRAVFSMPTSKNGRIPPLPTSTCTRRAAKGFVCLE